MTSTTASGVSDSTVFSGLAMSGRDYAAALLFKIGFILCLLLSVSLVTTSFWFATGNSITALHLPLAAIFTIGIAYFVGIRSRLRLTDVTLAVSISALIVTLATVLAGVFYDLSWVGQAIHQEAILQLADGWNPFHSRLDDSIQHAVWVMHYPKGPWLLATSIYEVTGSIETGKAPSIILIVVAWAFVTALLLQFKGFPVWLALTLSTVIALNPVSVYQGLTYYIDGQLSSLYISLLCLLFAALFRPDKYILIGISALVVLLINTKFTGLVYAVVLLTSFGAAALLKHGWQQTLRLSALPLASILTGILLVGYSPYVRNTMEHGTPFYPLFGEDAIDIVAHAKPEPMKSMNRVQALFTSVFSVSSNTKETVTPKNPLRLPSKGEIYIFTGNEMRVGGWGPWYGAMLILALPLAVLVLAACHSSTNKILLLFVLATISATVLINPESWWARYAPQLFLIPPLICIAYFTCFMGYMKWPGLIVVAVAVINLLMVAFPQAEGNLRGTINLNRQLAALAESDTPLIVSFSLFDADRIRLDEAGISYKTVASEEQLPCESPEILRNSFAKVKFCKSQS